jgi:DNA-directed RNA polymerase specialized sigma24 family protein
VRTPNARNTSLTVGQLRELLRSSPSQAAALLIDEVSRRARFICVQSNLVGEGDDIVGDVILRTLQDNAIALQRASAQTSLGAWVNGVARNVARERLRVNRRNGRAVVHLEQEANRRARCAHRRALRFRAFSVPAREHLTVPQSQALDLYVAGLTWTLIADRLGLRPSTARERVRRAWDALAFAEQGRVPTVRAALPTVSRTRLTSLGTKDQEAYRLWRAGRSVSEVALALRCTRNAAHCRVRRLRRALGLT